MMGSEGCSKTPLAAETSRPYPGLTRPWAYQAQGVRLMILPKDSWQSKMDFDLQRLRADGAGQ
jgi:hypothetical protein